MEEKDRVKAPIGEHIADHSITKDPAFVRIYADQLIPVFAPQTIDITALKIGGAIEACRVEEGEELPSGYKISPSITEVGRLTIPTNVAVAMAMGLIQQVAESGALNHDAVEGSFKDILETIRKADQPEGEKGE